MEKFTSITAVFQLDGLALTKLCCHLTHETEAGAQTPSKDPWIAALAARGTPTPTALSIEHQA